MSKSWYEWKGLVTRKAHVKYKSPKLTCFKDKQIDKMTPVQFIIYCIKATGPYTYIIQYTWNKVYM